MHTDKPTIAIDIDDVIADTNEAMRAWTNSKSNKELTATDFNIKGDYWGYYERVWAMHDLTLQFDDFQSEMIADQIDVPVLAGASFAIEELQKRFHIVLITSRYPELEPTTRRWMQAHLRGDIKLYFAKNDKKNSGRSKGELCKELGAFLLIDDNVEHVQSAVDGGIEAILFGTYGWQPRLPEGVTRCADWPAVLEYLNAR